MSKKLEGKIAFITGASRGIGAAVAHALTKEGVKLGLASRSGTDLGTPDALGLVCDVREREQVERAVAATVERFGRLDICIACAVKQEMSRSRLQRPPPTRSPSPASDSRMIPRISVPSPASSTACPSG